RSPACRGRAPARRALRGTRPRPARRRTWRAGTPAGHRSGRSRPGTRLRVPGAVLRPTPAPVVGWSHVLLELAVGERPLVHLVRAVGQAQRAGRGPEPGEREVLGDAARAVHLDGLVEDPL